MERNKPIIYIVDDEASMRRAMQRLILSMGMDVQTFSSGSEFLNSEYIDQNACLIADIKMPEMGGIEIQKKLLAQGSRLPVIFITAYDTDNMRDEAKKVGAAGYFRKPVDDQALLDSIQWALNRKPSQS